MVVRVDLYLVSVSRAMERQQILSEWDETDQRQVKG